MLTIHKILSLAWLKALDVWAEESKRAESLPDHKFAKAREEKAYTDVQFLGDILLVVEKYKEKESKE